MQHQRELATRYFLGWRPADVPLVEVDRQRLRIQLGECRAELPRGAGDQDAAA